MLFLVRAEHIIPEVLVEVFLHVLVPKARVILSCGHAHAGRAQRLRQMRAVKQEAELLVRLHAEYGGTPIRRLPPLAPVEDQREGEGVDAVLDGLGLRERVEPRADELEVKVLLERSGCEREPSART